MRFFVVPLFAFSALHVFFFSLSFFCVSYLAYSFRMTDLTSIIDRNGQRFVVSFMLRFKWFSSIVAKKMEQLKMLHIYIEIEDSNFETDHLSLVGDHRSSLLTINYPLLTCIRPKHRNFNTKNDHNMKFDI